MLRISVHNAERVPNLERTKNISPLVEITFQGIDQTKVFFLKLIE